MKERKLELIFTRDFSLFTCIFWRDQLLLKDVKEIWGIGISDQIMHFNGRLVESYRLGTEMQNMKHYIITLPTSHPLFSEKLRSRTMAAVKKIKKILTKKNLKNVEYTVDELLNLFSIMYPGYMLANFLPGPWAHDFRQIQGKNAEKIIKELYNVRLEIEGIFESIDLFIRKLVADRLTLVGYDPTLARFLTLSEVKKLLQGKPVNASTLNERSKEYVIIKGKLHTNKSFQGLLLDAKLSFDFTKKKVKKIKGVTAYGKTTVEGKAFLVFLSHHVNNFPDGGILVAPMTAPNFLPAIKKASAIVTDEGGITCHAAIVAREFKIPTIIATKIASKVIKNGETIKVDTQKGTIEIIQANK